MRLRTPLLSLLCLVAVVSAVAADEAPVASLEDVLNQRVSFAADKQTLGEALQQLSAEVVAAHPRSELAIQILAKDLELEGISRNQFVGPFEVKDLRVAVVLTMILRQANPLKEAPIDKQMLVWVRGPDPKDANRTIVLITTRKAAAKKYRLASPFIKT